MRPCTKVTMIKCLCSRYRSGTSIYNFIQHNVTHQVHLPLLAQNTHSLLNPIRAYSSQPLDPLEKLLNEIRASDNKKGNDKNSDVNNILTEAELKKLEWLLSDDEKSMDEIDNDNEMEDDDFEGIDFDELEEIDFDSLEYSEDYDDSTTVDKMNAINPRPEITEQVKQKVRIQRARHSKRRFVDRIRIRVTGGKGGNGCQSFFVDRSQRKRPNGGHGGAGGDVIIQASVHIQNLNNSTHHFKGGNGTNGQANDQAGKRGKTKIVRVPLGTVVKRVDRYERDVDEETGEYEVVDELEVVMDLDTDKAFYTAAFGGKPGLGNRILAGQTTKFGGLRKKMPSETKSTGENGTSQYYELELKTIADVGLVGFPNAGKSTLLSVLSKATPKIAAYPFTTLHPYVGIVEFPDFYKFSVADIPGLVDGAHRNIGLGHDFLRHIERTKILLYVLDTAGSEGRDPVTDFVHLQRELELYAPQITTRPSLIVANKMDEPEAEQNLHRLRKSTDMAVLPISALHAVDIKVVAESLRWMLQEKV